MKNVGASVRARLADLGLADGVGLDFMIERFAIGRLLFRTSKCPQADRFILKGAQLFTIWERNPHRPTRDIDFLGFGDSALEPMESFFRELVGLPADPEDGLIWGEPSVRYALSKIKGRTADSPSQGAPARLGNKIEDQIVEAFHRFSYASVSLVRFEKQG